MAIDAKRMPLRGVRIVTIEEWLQLPWATVNLAEMGAEVIRVESLGRMVVRNIGPYPDNKVGERFWNQGATYHNWYRSKKSLTLDLRTRTGRRHSRSSSRLATLSPRTTAPASWSVSA